jgi:hypothetical protein
MNVLSTTLRQLVRYKLWPVAVLLLAALVAVPVLLAREPSAPEPLTPLAVATEADDTIAEPVVAKVSTEDRDRRRRVLGVRKDPFEPAPVTAKSAKSAKTDDAEAPSSTPAPSSGGETNGGEPAPEKVYYEPGTIIVRFGEAAETATLERFAVEKMSPVPDSEFPVLVYMGLTRDGKKAKFLVDATIEVDGDGDCKPHPSNCEIIELAVGETEFLDVINPEPEEDSDEESTDEEETVDEDTAPEILASFQLDLVDIKRAGDDDVR